MNKKQTLQSIAGLTLVTLFAAPAAVPAQRPANLDRVMKAVFSGGELKREKIRGHEFNIKRAKIISSGGTVHVKGRISHHWRWVRDDQVDYSFTKENRVLKGKPEIKITKRGWREAAEWALRIGKYVWKYMQKKESTDSKQQLIAMQQASESIWKIGRRPSWEDVAQALVAEIILRADKHGDRFAVLSAKVKSSRKVSGPSFFKDRGFQGTSRSFSSDVSDLHRIGMGDTISSIRVPAGYRVTVYEHSNYKGRRVTFTGSCSDLKRRAPDRQNWGDKISSVKIHRVRSSKTSRTRRFGARR